MPWRNRVRFLRRSLLILLAAGVTALVVSIYETPYSLHRVRVVPAAGFDSAPDRVGAVALGRLEFDYRLPDSMLHLQGIERFREQTANLRLSVERVAASVAFVREHLNGADRSLPQSSEFDADSLLRSGLDNYSLCSDYSMLLNCILQSVGECSRVLWLDAHVVCEYFDRERRGWVFVDPQMNVWGLSDDGRPLSLTELIGIAEAGLELPLQRIGSDPPDVARRSVSFDKDDQRLVRWYRNVLLNGECSVLSGTTLSCPSRWEHLIRYGSTPKVLILSGSFDTSAGRHLEPLTVRKVLVVTMMLLLAFAGARFGIS